jgi:hypothetical protein
MTLGIFLYLDGFRPVSPLTGSSMCGFEDPIYDFHKGDCSERCEISLIDGTPILFSILSLTFILFKYKLSL